jgi:hypothetical protein
MARLGITTTRATTIANIDQREANLRRKGEETRGGVINWVLATVLSPDNKIYWRAAQLGDMRADGVWAMNPRYVANDLQLLLQRSKSAGRKSSPKSALAVAAIICPAGYADGAAAPRR